MTNRRTAATEVEEARADTTPMIDVVFLMIVFFVCIDFRVLEAKLPAFLPKDQGSSDAYVVPQEQLIVRVTVTEPGRQTFATGTAADTLDPDTGRPPRFTLRGHRVAWQVGPNHFTDLDAAQRELQRLAADSSLLVPEPATGGKKRMRCVVEGAPDTRYDDIAKAADACHAAGFDDLCFGMAPAKRG